MNKLIIIARSNYEVHDFLNSHNIKLVDIVIVKSLEDLKKTLSASSYVIIPPGPRGFHQFIRPYLILNKYKNVTKQYNSRLINF